MSELQVSGISKTFDKPVLRDLNLTVPPGSLTALLGPSGCGKTTLLRIIAGFLRPDAGTVVLGGRDLTHLPPERRHVGIVPQEGALFPHLNVTRNVAFGLSHRDRHRAEELLDLVGLPDHGTRMPHELSGGQQQRVALARALAPEPALVLLDEPFNALDAALRAGVRADVRAALRATGATALLVTHDQQEALSTADLVAVVRDGRVAQHGTPQDVYRHPATPWIAAFIGDAVLLPATAHNGTATTPLGPVPLQSHSPPGSKGTIVLRPEQLQLADPAFDTTPATVTHVRYYGHDAMLTLEIPTLNSPIEVRTPGPQTLTPGTQTAIRVTGKAAFHPTQPPDGPGRP